MNKKQAKKAALEIAVAVINKEWADPSGVTQEFANTQEELDKVLSALQEILNSLEERLKYY